MTDREKRDVEDFEDIRPLLRSGVALLIFLRFGHSSYDSIDASYDYADRFMAKLKSDLTSEEL